MDYYSIEKGFKKNLSIPYHRLVGIRYYSKSCKFKIEALIKTLSLKKIKL